MTLPRRFRNVRHYLEALLGQVVAALVAVLYHRQPSRQVCPDCAVDFVPDLTDQRCPICGWLAVDTSKLRAPRALQTRAATGLGLAWFIGALAFALVAHALYS